MVLSMVTDIEYWQEIMESGVLETAETDDLSVKTLITIVVFIIIIIMVIDLMISVYIGKSAVAVGKGQKTTAKYIPLTVIAALIHLNSVIYTLDNLFSAETFMDIDLTDTVSVFIDITSIFLLIELIHSTLMITSISKKLAEQAEEQKQENVSCS